MSSSPEKQSIGTCAALREGCRSAIFNHMDKQHQEQMTVLGKIEKKMAFQDGQEKTRNNSTWVPLIKRSVVMWSPGALFLMFVGFRQWGITKGWW